MKKSLLLVALSMIVSNVCFANGVERIVLPKDAKNITLKTAELSQYAVGEILDVQSIHDEFPRYDQVYETRLYVEVRYDSKDDRDAPKTGSGSDFGFTGSDDTRPMIMGFFPLSPDQVKMIQSKQVTAQSLVSMNIQLETVSIDDPKTQSVCPSDDNGTYPGCVEPEAKQLQVQLPVITIQVAH